jgi:hypothetical protein
MHHCMSSRIYSLFLLIHKNILYIKTIFSNIKSQSLKNLDFTIIEYSCLNTSIQWLPAGTLMYNDTTIITNYCSTDNCNTGTPVDTATLWCNFGGKSKNESKVSYFYKQSCTGSCAVSITYRFIYVFFRSIVSIPCF